MDYIETLHSHHTPRSWATIGAFDGVHSGHSMLFERLTQGAREAGCQSVAITFDPLPALYFNRIKTGQLLTSLDERIALIKSQGVDEVVVLEFNDALSNVAAADFMRQVKDAIGLERLLAGFNFSVGKDRLGTVAELKDIGSRMEFSVEVVQPVRHEREIISSSAIRNLLKAGEIEKANHYLGRQYTLSGQVIHGEHRGGKLGIPTANLSIPEERLLPANGVYASVAIINGRRYTAVTNIGVRPTFENPLPAPRVEPHLLDTEEEFYGDLLELSLISYLRPEIKFINAQALVDQIHKDIQQTRELITDET